MTETATQGLLYLTSGTLLFTLILFALRELGQSKNNQAGEKIEDKDIWAGTDKLVMVDIKSETHDIKTIRLQRKNGGLFPEFSEGQFISFQIGDPNDKIFRSYSISSPSTNRKTVNVSIKLLKGGLGSGWFHSRKIGDEVVAYSPGGLFTTKKFKYESVPLVFISGGIGITPFYSMLQTAADVGSRTPIYLFYGARTESDLAFHSEIDLLARRYNNIHYVPVPSEAGDDWSGKSGYITFDMVKENVTDWKSARYFFCGPPVLTNSITEKLEENNVESAQIHAEKFASPVSMDLSKVPQRQVKVSIHGNIYDYDGKESLLEFLENKGEDINFACRVGVCGSCKCKLIKGTVDCFSDSGLTKSESKAGYVQTCVARPLEDVEFEL